MSNAIDYEINKELGECYLFMGEFTKAREYYEKAVSSDGSKADPHMGLAAIALNGGDLQAALFHYSRANSLASNDKTLAGMGMVEMEMGSHDSAFGHFRDSLANNPANMVSINGLVQLGYFLNRLEQVVPFLEEAVQTEEGGTEAVRYTLAGCYTSLGRDADAKKQLEHLLGANPANDEARQLYARFAA